MFGEEGQNAQTISRQTTMGIANQVDRDRIRSLEPMPVSPILGKVNENDAILGGLINRLQDLEKRLEGVLGPTPPQAGQGGQSIPEALPSHVLYRLSDQTRGLEIANSIVSRINERLLV